MVKLASKPKSTPGLNGHPHPGTSAGFVTGGATASVLGTGGPMHAARRSRRPHVALVGAACVGVAALVGVVFLGGSGAKREVLVARVDIPAGSVIRTDLLTTARIDADSTIRAVSWGEVNSVADGVTNVAIPKGGVVLPEQVSRGQVAPAGEVLVGTVLDPGALPAPELRFGDRVQVVLAPSSPTTDDPTKVLTEATVWRVWAGPTATTATSRRAVTLAVPEGASLAVTEAAARSSIRLLVLPATPVIPSAVPGSGDDHRRLGYYDTDVSGWKRLDVRAFDIRQRFGINHHDRFERQHDDAHSRPERTDAD